MEKMLKESSKSARLLITKVAEVSEVLLQPSCDLVSLFLLFSPPTHKSLHGNEAS